jgi:hypothetical protein
MHMYINDVPATTDRNRQVWLNRSPKEKGSRASNRSEWFLWSGWTPPLRILGRTTACMTSSSVCISVSCKWALGDWLVRRNWWAGNQSVGSANENEVIGNVGLVWCLTWVIRVHWQHTGKCLSYIPRSTNVTVNWKWLNYMPLAYSWSWLWQYTETVSAFRVHRHT